MHRKEIKRFAKTLSYVLGHRPDEFGLVSDAEGFVGLKELLKALREEEEWSFVRRGHLQELLHSPEGKGFDWRDDRIRSASPLVSLTPEPLLSLPDRLFHAVRTRAHPVALRNGLRPSKGKWVILTRSLDMALRMGKRRDPEPVILEINSKEAVLRGVRFYSTQGLLIFAEFIPKEFIIGPQLKVEQDRRETHKPRQETTKDLPGSFFLDQERISKKGRDSTHKRREISKLKERKKRAHRKRDRWRD